MIEKYKAGTFLDDKGLMLKQQLCGEVPGVGKYLVLAINTHTDTYGGVNFQDRLVDNI